MKCKKTNKIFPYIFGIFSQITIIFIFLVVFYFNYIKFVEKNTFLHQIDEVLDNLTKNIRPHFPTNVNSFIISELQQEIKQIKKNNIQSNKSINQKNQTLSNLSMNMVFICISVFLVYSFTITLYKICLPLKSVLFESILAFSFIALTEYLFLKIVVVNYKSIDSNYIRYAVAQAIKKYAQTQLKNK